jgi:zinc transport system substrate-binding protein
MKKILTMMTLLFTTMILASCQETAKYDVVTTLLPQYDMAKAIAGDDLSVYNILPFGTSPHTFEITSKDRQMIETSSLFIYTSDTLENWVNDITLNTTVSLNLELELNVEHHDHDDHDEAHEDDHDDHDDAHEDDHDVHYWTNPETMKDMVNVILDHLIEIKPDLASTFTLRAESYVTQLNGYIDELHTFLEKYINDDIHLYIAGHNAMAEFGDYFNIEIISLFPNFIPDAELSSLELTTFISELNEHEIKAFFIEPLFDSEPLAAQTIKATLDAQNQPTSFYELHQFHNMSADDFNNNLSLFDIFENNIENIKLVVELNYGTR